MTQSFDSVIESYDFSKRVAVPSLDVPSNQYQEALEAQPHTRIAHALQLDIARFTEKYHINLMEHYSLEYIDEMSYKLNSVENYCCMLIGESLGIAQRWEAPVSIINADLIKDKSYLKWLEGYNNIYNWSRRNNK